MTLPPLRSPHLDVWNPSPSPSEPPASLCLTSTLLDGPCPLPPPPPPPLPLKRITTLTYVLPSLVSSMMTLPPLRSPHLGAWNYSPSPSTPPASLCLIHLFVMDPAPDPPSPQKNNNTHTCAPLTGIKQDDRAYLEVSTSGLVEPFTLVRLLLLSIVLCLLTLFCQGPHPHLPKHAFHPPPVHLLVPFLLSCLDLTLFHGSNPHTQTSPPSSPSAPPASISSPMP